MDKRQDPFGINVMQYCREHNAYVEERLDARTNLEELLAYHGRKIRWLQHERLVHLLVTIWTSLIVLFLFHLELTGISNLLVVVLLLVFLVLLGFYLFHYFRLENMVQHWYKVYDRIRRELESVRGA